jgi:hypothetical protein
MTGVMSPEERYRALRALDVPEAKARKAAGFLLPTANVENAAAVLRPNLTFPLRLVLPWSSLVSDNDKYGVAMRGNGSNAHPILLLKPEYRRAKDAANKRAVEAMTVEGVRLEPLTQPLALVARVWVPDNRPGHDVANFAKCAHDAFERVVYAKDEWLHDVRWIRAGVDVDAPRAEIEIRPL